MSTTKKPTRKRAKKVSGKAATENSAPQAAPAKKKAAVKKPAAKKRVRKKVIKPITASQRHTLIAEEAYLMAEANGFRGDASGHWLHAETQVDASLAMRGYELSA